MSDDVTGGQGPGTSGELPGMGATGNPPGGAGVSASAEGFKLEAGQPRKWRGADMERFSKLYGKDRRSIFRWIKEGAKHGDPCPLDRPAEMPGWWARNMKWGVPAGIEAAAVAAMVPSSTSTEKNSQNIPEAAVVGSDIGNPISAGSMGIPMDPSAGAGAAAPPVKLEAYDLTAFDLADGELVRNQRRIVALAFEKVKRAAELGDANFDRYQDRYVRAGEALRKLQKDDREDREKSGALKPVAEMESELARMAELLRQMRASMARRVLELCPSLTSEQRLQVVAAIERARESEEAILARLDILSGDEIVKELAA